MDANASGEYMDRIDDLEQSLMTLARFVKDETTKLKAENENIRNSINSSSKGPKEGDVPAVRLFTNKVIELETKINDIQKKIAGLMLKVSDKKPGDSYASKLADHSSKFSNFESRIADLQNKITLSSSLEKRLSKLEQKKGGSDNEVKELSTTLESQIRSLASEVQKLKQNSEPKEDANTKYYMDRLTEQISNLENDLQSKIETARSTLDDEFQNRLDGLKMVLDQQIQEKNPSEIEKEISEIREESFAEEAYLDRRLQDTTIKFEKAFNYEELEKKIDKKLEEFNEQVALKVHALESLENKMNQALEEKLMKVEQEEKTQESGLGKNWNTRVEELEEKISLKLHALESLENKMNEMLGRKINMLEADEGIETASADKKVQDLHKIVAVMQQDIVQMKNGDILGEKAVRKDVEALKQRVKFFDDHIKTIATKHMTKQLEEFAHYLDGKIPEVVTLEEFQRHMEMINKKMSAIEAPDTAQIMQRIGEMEKEIKGVLTELKDIYSGMPKFVE